MLTLFFVDNLPTQVGNTYHFDGDDAQHAVRVLRMRAGETFMLSDGKGRWSQVKIFAVLKKALDVEVIFTGFQEPLATTFTIVQGLPKGDRSKESIELLTQAGADRIVPWSASRSIGKSSEKFEITAREASKQSRRLRIPEICEIASTEEVCQLIRESELAIVFHESATKKLSDCITTANIMDALIVIGPEGGISPDELIRFEAAGADIALMGRPVLRSAHAGIAALSAISALLKVW